MKTAFLKIGLLSVLSFFAWGASAQTTNCNFTRDLWTGLVGEDVRCLQQYLNSNSGYGTNYGLGYGANFYQFGYADGVFGPITQQAVMMWQTNRGLPATGYFDAASRAKYFELTGGAGLGLGYAGSGYGYFGGNSYFWGNTVEGQGFQRKTEALKLIEDADDDGQDVDEAEDLLEEAEDALNDAEDEFDDKDYDDAEDFAKEAEDLAQDAIDAID